MTHNPQCLILSLPVIYIYCYISTAASFIKWSQLSLIFLKVEVKFVSARPLNWSCTIQLICVVNGFRCCCAQCHPCLPNHLKQRSNSAVAMSKSAKRDPIRNEILCSWALFLTCSLHVELWGTYQFRYITFWAYCF